MHCQPPNRDNYVFVQPQEIPSFLQKVVEMQGTPSKKVIRLFGESFVNQYQLPQIKDINIDETLQKDFKMDLKQYELPIFNNCLIQQGKYKDYEYEGQYAKGEMYGKGCLFNQMINRLVFGYFGLDMNIQGSAIDISQDVIYEGQYKDNLRNGTFSLYLYILCVFLLQSQGNGIFMNYTQKVFYVGEFINDEYSGKGRLINEKSKVQYEGMFYEGEYSGSGVLCEEGDEYRGEMSGGMRHGQGMQMKSGVKIYEGWYKVDKQHGMGVSYDENELVQYDGYFKDGLRHGYGKAYTVQGDISEQGWYQEGQYKGYKRVFNANENQHIKNTFNNNNDSQTQKKSMINVIADNQQRLIGNQIQQSQMKSSLYSNLYVSQMNAQNQIGTKQGSNLHIKSVNQSVIQENNQN